MVGRREGHGVLVGAVLAVADVMIFHHYMGAGLTDQMAFEANNSTGERAERTALYTCVALNTVTSFLTRSWEAFIISNGVTVVVDFANKHANAVNPSTGQMTQGQAMTGSNTGANVMPLPNYNEMPQAYGYAS